MIELYDYYRSTASFRVRIALNFKDLPYTLVPVHLVKDGGQQNKAEYRALNPQGLVPTLCDSETNALLTQSYAIIEYLDERFPEPPLLPLEYEQRAKARSIALSIACEIHPLNNLRVLKYLTGPLGLSDKDKMTWYHHWLMEGFTAIEKILSLENQEGPYCLGNLITLADVFLIPQVYNANRFEFSLGNFPLIQRVNEHCLAHPAFEKAHPDNQANES